MKKWIYVGHVRSHTHDIRALTVAVPICREGIYFSYWSLSQRKFFSLSSFLLMSFFFQNQNLSFSLGGTLGLLVKPKLITSIIFCFIRPFLFSYLIYFFSSRAASR